MLIGGIIWDFVFGLIWLIVKYLLMAFAACLVVGLALTAIVGFLVMLYSHIVSPESRSKPFRKKKRLRVTWKDRVRLKDSPLFTSCLQKIQEGSLTTLYVNPYMACFNFRLPVIREEEILDFQKCGYAQIPEVHIQQYMEQLRRRAARTPYVKSAKLVHKSFQARPYLIYDGYYNRTPEDESCLMLEVEYSSRIRKGKGLQSFQVK